MVRFYEKRSGAAGRAADCRSPPRHPDPGSACAPAGEMAEVQFDPRRVMTSIA